MYDPYDVKSVRQSTQYVSCMKLNGVPLLPPVLSKECRKEMQYYKLLAQEVEKRISFLKPLVSDICSDSEDGTDAPELLECEYNSTSRAIEKVKELEFDKTLTESFKENKNQEQKEPLNSPTFVIDLSFSINNTGSFETECRRTQQSSPINDLPERDCNCLIKKEKEIKKERDEIDKKNEKQIHEIDDVRFSIGIEKGLNKTYQDDGPTSLASKSFTGSLIDIHKESAKEKTAPSLVRQRSYTVLNPSPQLLAHLEVQSLSTGMDVASISMSDSISNLSITPGKKRRSWDLESAKSKWSLMAVELNKNPKSNSPRSTRPAARKSPTQMRARSVDPVKKRQVVSTPRTWPMKAEPKKASPYQNQIMTREPAAIQPSRIPQLTPKTPKQEALDPAARIRELYDRIKNEQLIKMANLIEKQKREQLLLQQVFEEQNNLFYKQLKTIAPKETIEIKEAWGDKSQEDQPVSLSQLINHKPEASDLSTTLTDTKNYINHCEEVLKKSRDITTSLNKEAKSFNGNVTRTHSPTGRTRSTPRRKIIYESSSSEREYEPILTDRTNDTMADLNVTFSTDESRNDPFYSNNTVVNNFNNVTVVRTCGVPNESVVFDDASVNIVDLQRLGQDMCQENAKAFDCNVSERERWAASVIVAHAKGYLTRRLMRTEKVQGTVQTIKDALLCALELHQDRNGIRGADVDLHRRLIQQITAACYSLHEALVAAPAAARCALIAADRARAQMRTRNSSARSSFSRHSPGRNSFNRSTDVMSASYPAPPRKRPSSCAMTQSNYETYSDSKSPLSGSARCVSPRRRPWR